MIYSVSENFELSLIIQLIPNRMKNLHLYLDMDFGKESSNNICHTETLQHMWSFHLPPQQVTIPPATIGNQHLPFITVAFHLPHWQ